MVNTGSDANEELKAKLKRPSFTSVYFVHFINVFAKCKGFEVFEAILYQGSLSNLNQKGTTNMLKICLSVLTILG
jgi:hypothetical protein